jgi:hypothetical protein
VRIDGAAGEIVFETQGGVKLTISATEIKAEASTVAQGVGPPLSGITLGIYNDTTHNRGTDCFVEVGLLRPRILITSFSGAISAELDGNPSGAAVAMPEVSRPARPDWPGGWIPHRRGRYYRLEHFPIAWNRLAGGRPAQAAADPFDRMLMAQAMLENLHLVSIKRAFDVYGVAPLS